MSSIKSKIPIEENEYQHEFGMSFADLMSTLVGTFLILTMFFMFLSSSQTENIISKHQEGIKQLKASEEKIENLIGIKQSLITELKETFDKSNLNVSIDYETGAIRFSDKVLFDYDSATISPNGKKYLNKFIPKYMSSLLTNKASKNISEIIIEGHTDNKGSYLYNLELSQRRALEVSKYILSNEMPYFKGKENVRQYLTSTGKSFNVPIYANNKIDCDSSRRVEFKFRLKEEDTMREIQAILKK